MSFFPSDNNVVKRGRFLYDHSVQCDVCIVYSTLRYGSGDEADPIELREDLEIDTFYLWFGSTTERGRFNAGGGSFPSLHAAIANAESRAEIGIAIQWQV